MADLRRVVVLLLAAACAGPAQEPFAVHDVHGTSGWKCRLVVPGSATDDLYARLRVLATGDTRGLLVPCGCEADQRGGIARRKGFLDAEASPGDLRLDLGNAAAGTGPARMLRMESTFRALEAMGYAACVPGRAEVVAGADFDAAREAAPGLRFVCANLSRADGAAAFPATLTHVLPDGRRVALVGVTEHVESPGAHFRTSDPLAAVRTEIDGLRGRADAVIVAAALPWTQAVALADALDGVAFVVGGLLPEDERAPPVATRTPFAATGPRGEHVLEVGFDAALRPAYAQRVWLTEGVPEDAAMAELTRAHRKAMSALDPEFVPDVLAGLVGRGFAGSETCIPCHEPGHGVWKGSGHSHAMTTLVAKEASRDPECVPCHLVDVPAEAGGPRVPDDLGVGCEACHGGSLRHVESARAGRTPPERTPVPATAEDCRACHRPPEVTRFDFAEAWPKIEHGTR